MRLSITSISAANLLYRAMVYFLLSFFMLGAFEYLTSQNTLMPVISPYIALIALIMSIAAISLRR
ncbi:hypothetical protein, partial [Pseudoalteromonas sp.]|uniref:hypothetical protein n=1 Tax=Pseudoalteromonas sp. TaxID=53249 RepID=UPI0035628D45